MNSRPLAVIAAALFVLPACGNGDSPDEAASPTTVATATAAPEPTETEQARPADQPKTKTRTYRVQNGDSLSEIAARFDTTVQALVRLNDIKDRHHIRVGQELKVPARN